MLRLVLVLLVGSLDVRLLLGNSLLALGVREFDLDKNTRITNELNYEKKPLIQDDAIKQLSNPRITANHSRPIRTIYLPSILPESSIPNVTYRVLV